jgi:hypothetical protein
MHATINAAHEAYRHAAALAPDRPDDQPIDVAWRYVDAPGTDGIQLRCARLAATGAILSLIAGGLCGALLL